MPPSSQPRMLLNRAGKVLENILLDHPDIMSQGILGRAGRVTLSVRMRGCQGDTWSRLCRA